MKKILVFVLAIVLAVSVMAGCGSTEKAGYTANNTEYIIGATGPLTGDTSSYGISVQEGAQLAVEEINANGGLNGVNFKLDMKDDKSTESDAATGYDMLYESGMQISIGSVTSGSCNAFATKAAADNLFFITPSASAADCIKEPNAFRICFGDPDQGMLAARELVKTYTNIGAIYDTSDPYSSGIYEAFKAEMGVLGKDFLTQSFDAENKKDFSTQVEALKDCDVIFLPMYYTEAGLIAKAAAAKGCNAVLFGSDGFDGISSQVDATVTNTIQYITPFDVNSTDETVAAFVTAYKAKYNKTPDQFAADGYDAVMVIFEAMKAAGVNDVTIAPDELCEIVKSTITSDSFEYTGATGTMTWDVSGAPNKALTIIELNK